MSNFHTPAIPSHLKIIQHYLKLASDYEDRETTITYWARLYTLQTALKIDKKSPEARNLLTSLMDWLESCKKANLTNECITSDIAAQALIENEAHKLFTKADAEDRAARFDKNVVKAFYTAGILYDICEVFGELSEENTSLRKYAKWKATYIHNCLKKGEQPMPGPAGGDSDELLQGFGNEIENSTSTFGFNILPVAQNKNPIDHIPSEQPSILLPEDKSNQHYVISPQPTETTEISDGLKLNPSEIAKAQKYCKYAISALDYEDAKTALDNLHKAISLLTTGSE